MAVKPGAATPVWTLARALDATNVGTAATANPARTDRRVTSMDINALRDQWRV
jgi:hypothetical protein